jgi:Tol biopolymer transport system component
MRRFRLAITAAVVVGSIVATAAAAGATFPGTNGEIAYWRSGGWRSDESGYSLRTMNPDGSPGRVLWPEDALIGIGLNQAMPYDAEWSPDGSMVAMIARGETLGGDRLVIGDPATGERHVILRISSFNDHAFFASIAFDPAGDRLLLCARELNREAHLYTLAVDGSDLTLVSDRRACLADWSSTNRIVAVGGDLLNKIVTMAPDGSDRHVVVPSATRPTVFPFGDSPSWSPDGSRIAYSLEVGSKRKYDLFSVAADGSARVRLTHTPFFDERFPLYSPDGSAIAFSRSRDFAEYLQSDVFTVDADGSNEQQLTDTSRRYEFTRSWQALS